MFIKKLFAGSDYVSFETISLRRGGWQRGRDWKEIVVRFVTEIKQVFKKTICHSEVLNAVR